MYRSLRGHEKGHEKGHKKGPSCEGLTWDDCQENARSCAWDPIDNECKTIRLGEYKIRNDRKPTREASKDDHMIGRMVSNELKKKLSNLETRRRTRNDPLYDITRVAYTKMREEIGKEAYKKRRKLQKDFMNENDTDLNEVREDEQDDTGEGDRDEYSAGQYDEDEDDKDDDYDSSEYDEESTGINSSDLNSLEDDYEELTNSSGLNFLEDYYGSSEYDDERLQKVHGTGDKIIVDDTSLDTTFVLSGLKRCNIDATELTSIGEGHYGTVYKDEKNDVYKMIYNTNDCNSSVTEMKLQGIIYNAFENLATISAKGLTSKERRILSHVTTFVRIARPKCAYNGSVNVGGRKFKCFFVMDLLHGISLRQLQHLDPRATSNIVEEVQVHPLQTSLFGLIGCQKDKPVSELNGVRGYYASTVITKALLKNYMNTTDLENVIKFVYLWIVFKCDIIPYDIEITLGYDQNDHLNINVLDFGMASVNTDKLGLDRIIRALDSEYVTMFGYEKVNTQTTMIIEMCANISKREMTFPTDLFMLHPTIASGAVPAWADETIFLRMQELMERQPTEAEYNENKDFI